jgi:hypothetical protein
MILIDKWKILISIEIDWYDKTLSQNVFLVKILNVQNGTSQRGNSCMTEWLKDTCSCNSIQ